MYIDYCRCHLIFHDQSYCNLSKVKAVEKYCKNWDISRSVIGDSIGGHEAILPLRWEMSMQLIYKNSLKIRNKTIRMITLSYLNTSALAFDMALAIMSLSKTLDLVNLWSQ